MRPAVKTVLYGRNSLDDYVRAGLAYVVNPTTDTGYFSYLNGSRLALPAATVLCIDPQGTASTFWGTSTAHTTLTPNTTVPLAVPDNAPITKCLKLEHDGTADAPVTAAITVVASTSYNDSIYVYAPTLGGNLTITSEVGHTFSVAALTGANAGWVRYSVQANTVGGEVVKGLKFTFAGGTASTVYVTGYNPIASSILTPYGDGSYPGWAWSNPALPHASTSVRTASVLKFMWMAATLGTIAIRTVPLFAGNDDLQHRCITYNNPADTVGWMSLGKLATNAWRCYLGGESEGSLTALSGAQSFAAGTTHTLVGRSTTDGTAVDLNSDGTDAAQAGGALTLGNGVGASLILGSNGVTVWADGYIGPILISPARAADAFVTTLQGNGGALYADVMGMVELSRRYNLQPFMIIPLQSDSRAFVVVG